MLFSRSFIVELSQVRPVVPSGIDFYVWCEVGVTIASSPFRWIIFPPCIADVCLL